MDVCFAVEEVTNKMGIWIFHNERNLVTIVNPKDSPISSHFNYFITLDPKVMKDCVCGSSFKVIKGGSQVYYDDFDSFRTQLDSIYGTMLPSRRPSEYKELFAVIQRCVFAEVNPKYDKVFKLVEPYILGQKDWKTLVAEFSQMDSVEIVDE